MNNNEEPVYKWTKICRCGIIRERKLMMAHFPPPPFIEWIVNWILENTSATEVNKDALAEALSTSEYVVEASVAKLSSIPIPDPPHNLDEGKPKPELTEPIEHPLPKKK